MQHSLTAARSAVATHLSIAQGKAQDADGKAVNEHQAGQVTTRQAEAVCAEAIEHEAQADGCKDGAEGYLGDGELAVGDILVGCSAGGGTLLCCSMCDVCNPAASAKSSETLGAVGAMSGIPAEAS